MVIVISNSSITFYNLYTHHSQHVVLWYIIYTTVSVQYHFPLVVIHIRSVSSPKPDKMRLSESTATEFPSYNYYNNNITKPVMSFDILFIYLHQYYYSEIYIIRTEYHKMKQIRSMKELLRFAGIDMLTTRCYWLT